ncbi:MAG TPA: RodZ domain-containing protein [Bacteroidota bacterium]|nr:RodZ domain-containing protein [Bacteroidota bacterium]
MSSIGEILKKAREERGRTIDDIAAATRINKKFLQQIEESLLSDLPQTYIKAFTVSYAREVGIDPEALLHEPAVGQTVMRAIQSVLAPVPRQTAAENTNAPTGGSRVVGNPLLILAALTMVAIVCLAALIQWIRSERPSDAVQETPFTEVAREHDLNRNPHAQPIALPESSLVVRTGKDRDSLLLEGTATDTVWVRIVRDTNPAQEYTFAPGFVMHWKAKDYFVLSLGNGSAMTFKLNGKSVGALGKIRKPLSNIDLSWITLDTMQKPPVKIAVKKASGSLDSIRAANLSATEAGKHALPKFTKQTAQPVKRNSFP